MLDICCINPLSLVWAPGSYSQSVTFQTLKHEGPRRGPIVLACPNKLMLSMSSCLEAMFDECYLVLPGKPGPTVGKCRSNRREANGKFTQWLGYGPFL
jgi:hypothetical protein